MPMRWTLAGMCWIGLLAGFGCRSNSRTDLLEAELRTRERQLHELQSELARTRAVNQAFEHELRTVVPGPISSLNPETALVLGPLQGIELGRGTGGVDEDNIPGDENLLLVVVPRDQDGSEVKATGSLSVTAFEVTPEGVKLPLSSWEIPAVSLRPTWKSGLFSTGFHVLLAWKTPPTTEQLRVVVQFRLTNGRVYETDKDIKIRPLLNIPRPTYVPPQPGPELLVPPLSEELPPPREQSSSLRVELLPPEPMR